jgi:hypothetical protein
MSQSETFPPPSCRKRVTRFGFPRPNGSAPPASPAGRCTPCAPQRELRRALLLRS